MTEGQLCSSIISIDEESHVEEVMKRNDEMADDRRKPDNQRKDYTLLLLM